MVNFPSDRSQNGVGRERNYGQRNTLKGPLGKEGKHDFVSFSTGALPVALPPDSYWQSVRRRKRENSDKQEGG